MGPPAWVTAGGAESFLHKTSHSPTITHSPGTSSMALHAREASEATGEVLRLLVHHLPWEMSFPLHMQFTQGAVHFPPSAHTDLGDGPALPLSTIYLLSGLLSPVPMLTWVIGVGPRREAGWSPYAQVSPAPVLPHRSLLFLSPFL